MGENFLQLFAYFFRKGLCKFNPAPYFCIRNREMAEWSIAAVLKTVDPKGSGGSNPSLSAKGDLQGFLLASPSFFSPYVVDTEPNREKTELTLLVRNVSIFVS